MASADAIPVPRKNTAWRWYFWIFDNTGAPVAGAAGLDAEVSIDGAAFTDITTGTEVEVGSGLYYIDITGPQMNGDHVGLICKTTTTNAKQACRDVYPEEQGDIRINPVTIWDVLESAIGTASSIGVKLKNVLPVRPPKNVPMSNFPFMMIDASDDISGKTAVSVAATISKDGGAFAPCANSATEISAGWYKINLTQGEMNADVIILKFSGAPCNDTGVTIFTQSPAA